MTSLLDTDLYKLTMQACVHKHFSDAKVEYLLRNRSTDKHLSQRAVDWIQEQVNLWATLRITETELAFLRRKAPYLPDTYFEFLKEFKLDPQNEVAIDFRGGSDLSIKVSGAWDHTIWYEVPILATISEAYFKFVDTDWDYHGQYELCKDKIQRLIDGECTFSEFGTRRRRSHDSQKLVVQVIADHFKDSKHFLGTSNVHFAQLFNLTPVGTVAHELTMGVAAYLNDYQLANLRSMEKWIDTVGHEHAGVALTDTFGTAIFLRDFKAPYVNWYQGVRQDSGDAEQFTELISKFYEASGIPPNTKKIIYSDSLNVERCMHLRDVARKWNLIPGFGIGTYFTNDFCSASDPTKRSQPLNIVMKISKVNGRPAVKLSDNAGKNTGDPAEVERAKKIVDYVEPGGCIDEISRWN